MGNDKNQIQKTIFVGVLAIIIVIATTVLIVVGKQSPSWFEAVTLLSVGYMVGKGT